MVDLGPELLQLRRALLRDDDADEEAHQADDPERRDTHQLELADNRLRPEARRMGQQAEPGDDDVPGKA